MSKEERQFLDELRNKSIEAAAEIMESLQRLKLLYDDITDDGSGTPLPRPRPADFFYRLARFEMEHAANVIRLGNSQAEMIFDHVRQLSRRTRGGASGPATTQVVTLAPEPADQPTKYIGRFEIKNPFDSDADARFEIPLLRDNAGRETALQPTAKAGTNILGGHRTAYVQIEVAAPPPPSQGLAAATLFGEITVFLSAETERQVAKRAIKLRPVLVEETRPPTTETSVPDEKKTS